MSGRAQGGFALPLWSDPHEVWKTFLYDQEAVAKKRGAIPNFVTDGARKSLFEPVDKSRQTRMPQPAI
jgi:hypothetical protein